MYDTIWPFGAIADIYHQARPPTPADMVDWLTDGEFRDVLDLAAGTGLLTEALLRRQPPLSRVHAVEPDERMLAQFRINCPRADATQGTAEALPLDDSSVDGVFVGDAWQWFDRSAASKEIARVLRPNGVLGVVWNLRDPDVPWMADMEALLPQRRWLVGAPGEFTVSPSGPFGLPERREQRWEWSISLDTLMTSITTYSTLLQLAGAEAVRHLYAVRLYLEARFGGDELIPVPIRTVAYRTRLLAER